jgi:hypothetical protein
MSLDKAIVEYNLQSSASKYFVRRVVDYVLDFAPLRRTIVTLFVLINISSLGYCTYMYWDVPIRLELAILYYWAFGRHFCGDCAYFQWRWFDHRHCLVLIIGRF